MGKGTMRNHLCPCGSGKKYKKCHYISEYDTLVKRRAELTEQIKAQILKQVSTKSEAEALLKKVKI